MKAYVLGLALLAGCSGPPSAAPDHIGQWTSEERREAIYFTDSGQVLLQRDGREQLALGSYRAPRAELKWDQSTAAKDLSLTVDGDRLAVTVAGAPFGFNREPAHPPLDSRLVGLWQNRDFERRDFTSYGCVITSFKGGGIKIGHYTTENGQVRIEDASDPGDVTTMSYAAQPDSLSLGSTSLRRIQPGPWE